MKRVILLGMLSFFSAGIGGCGIYDEDHDRHHEGWRDHDYDHDRDHHDNDRDHHDIEHYHD